MNRYFKPFLNKSKYARNAGGSLPSTESEEDDANGSSGTSKGSSNKFDKIEEEESEEGVTTIGFGGKSASKSNSKPIKMVSFSSRMDGDDKSESTTQIGFGSKGNDFIKKRLLTRACSKFNLFF